MGKITNAYKIVVENPEGKRPFGRHRRRREDNIKIYLREIPWEAVDRNHMSQDRDARWGVVNTGSMKGGKYDYLNDY
jgi:hypothetical protein